MKCYNHNDIDAVATCKECGKHLCKECYDGGQRGTCSECIVELHKEAIKETAVKNKEYHYTYIKNSLIALVVGVIIGLIIAGSMNTIPQTHNSMKLADFRVLNFIVVPLLLGYGMFSLYWGVKILSKIMNKILTLGLILIFTWPVLIIVLCVAIFIGVYAAIPMFIYHFVKFISHSHSLNLNN